MTKTDSEQKIDYKVVEIRRVAKVTEGGKRLKIRAVVVVGNHQGRVGIGIAKGDDFSDAVSKAKKAAEKNMISVPIINGTVPYSVKAKIGAAEILIKPAKSGKGLVAGSAARNVLALAGYKDVSAKILGVTKNVLLNTFVTLKALSQYQDYDKKKYIKELLKGKKLVTQSESVDK